MSAYIIVEIDVTDPERYEAYRKLAPGAIAASGGRFVVRGGEMAVLEGDWSPKRLVVLEFPTLDAAKAFYESPLYREAREVRAGAAKLNMVAVAGA
jgi:uncharacterized protein (DUF1330 family)